MPDSAGTDSYRLVGTRALRGFADGLVSILLPSYLTALGLSATVISSVVGVSLGLLSGYRRGLVGDVILRIADAQLAFPFLVLAIALLAVSVWRITPRQARGRGIALPVERKVMTFSAAAFGIAAVA